VLHTTKKAAVCAETFFVNGMDKAGEQRALRGGCRGVQSKGGGARASKVARLSHATWSIKPIYQRRN